MPGGMSHLSNSCSAEPLAAGEAVREACEPPPMRLCVCFHDQCFDGACSAALFTRVYQSRMNPAVEFVYKGLMHRAGQLFDDGIFDCDENAIVDFKYSSSDRLTWWFDHHQSAFLTAADAEHFHQDRSGRKFYNPEFRSC